MESGSLKETECFFEVCFLQVRLRVAHMLWSFQIVGNHGISQLVLVFQRADEVPYKVF